MYSYLYAYIYGIFFMADITADSLKQMLIDILIGANSGPKEKTTAPNDAGGTLAKMIENAALKLGDVAAAGGAAAIGLGNVKDAAGAWSKTVEALAQKTDRASRVLGDTIRYIDYSRQLSVDAGKSGIGQGNGVAAEGKAQGAGFDNLKDEIGAIGKYGNAARSYGNSADDANNKFLDFGKKLQDSEMAGKLKSLGLNTAREIANVASLAAAGKEEMMNSAEGRKKLAEDTAVLAAEIYKTSQATGRNREEIVSEMAERKASARSIQEDRAYRTDAERMTAEQTRTATAGLGKSMQDITSTIMAGGYLDKTKRTELQVATGGRAGQYMAAVRDNRRTANLADNDPQKLAAKARLDAEIARANDNIASTKFNRRALTTQNPEQKAAYDKITLEASEAGRQRAIQKETGMGPVAAREDMRKRAGANLEGRTQEGINMPAGAPGTMNDSAKLSQNMQGLSENFRKNAAGMTTALGELNAEMGRSPQLLKSLTSVGTLGGKIPENMSQDQANRNAKENVNTVLRPLGLNTGEDADANKAAANTPGAAKLRKNQPKAEGQRDHGTLGETGSPTEPKDIIAKLHKGETVATPEQLKNLMSGSASNAISELMKSATTKTTTNAAGGNIDISKITSGLKEITTTISSVSGGGSTTRTRVENDDAKNAKKELEAVKSQFQTEKNDIRTQVKSNLGADAKPVDIMRAMRDNPQAKALEARMQEQTAKLSERIGAGTQIKTSQEAGINRTAINDMSSESMTESISDKLASIKNKKEIEEPAIEEPAIEESKFEEKSDKVGLNDLNEQLIQLNTSIRQLIQHSAESVETAGKQVKATKGLSGNRFA